MTRDEFVWKIDHGDDIEFSVGGRKYVIFSWWYDDGFNIVEAYSDGDGDTYQTAEELIDNFMVGEKALRDLLDDVKITGYTQVRE